jgi:Fe-S-cluster containining protein
MSKGKGKQNKKHKKALKRKKKLAEQRKHSLASAERNVNQTDGHTSLAKTPNDISKAHPILSLHPLEMAKEIGNATVSFFNEAKSNGLTADSFSDFFPKATAKCDEVVSAGKDLVGIDCGPDCPYCCYARVEAVPPELFSIKQYMDTELTQEQCAGIKSRIDSIVAEGRPHELDYWTHEKVPCPFLEDDTCSIYDARPLLCRQQNSMNAERCKHAHNDPSDDDIESWQAPKHLYSTVQGALVASLKKAGLTYQPIELSSGMKILLDDPENEKRWRVGEDPFSPAVADQQSGEKFAAMFTEILEL